MLAAQEFERDVVVHRLTHGLLTKKATNKRINQCSQIKVNSARGILERNAPNGQTAQQCDAQFGWRVLAARMSETLGHAKGVYAGW